MTALAECWMMSFFAVCLKAGKLLNCYFPVSGEPALGGGGRQNSRVGDDCWFVPIALVLVSLESEHLYPTCRWMLHQCLLVCAPSCSLISFQDSQRIWTCCAVILHDSKPIYSLGVRRQWVDLLVKVREEFLWPNWDGLESWLPLASGY